MEIMKHTNIIEEGTLNLLLGFSSEVAWIPLNIGDCVESEEEFEMYEITQKIFSIESDLLSLYVKKI